MTNTLADVFLFFGATVILLISIAVNMLSGVYRRIHVVGIIDVLCTLSGALFIMFSYQVILNMILLVCIIWVTSTVLTQLLTNWICFSGFSICDD